MASIDAIKLNIGPSTWSDAHASFTFTSAGDTALYIDPKTLKPCKHRWVPKVTETTCGWDIVPKCDKCGAKGTPEDKGVSLRKLVKQLG